MGFKFQKPGPAWDECMCCGATPQDVEFRVTITIATGEDSNKVHVCTICGMQILGYMSAIESGIIQTKGDDDE